MIVSIVQEVKSCTTCPNFRRICHNAGRFVENYMCLASGKKLGDSNTRYSTTNLKENVSVTCPYRDEEVNKRPIREE